MIARDSDGNYFAYFKQNNEVFRIVTSEITETELIAFIESLIKS